MAHSGVFKRFHGLGSALVIGAALVAIMPAPASAQGFFDLLFGGFRRQAPPQSYADPRSDGREGRGSREDRDDDGRRSDVGGPGVSYCVRMCDGRHFPINYRGTSSPAEICKSFCPAAPTKIFSGGNIDRAVANDGKRYSDIPNAFVYRDKLVPGCSCDGKSPTGLARTDIDDDPTLRQGDIVVTDSGLMAYRGEKKNTAQFVPAEDAPGYSAAQRKQLSQMRVLPARTAEEIGETTGAAAPMSRNVDQRGQASR